MSGLELSILNVKNRRQALFVPAACFIVSGEIF